MKSWAGRGMHDDDLHPFHPLRPVRPVSRRLVFPCSTSLPGATGTSSTARKHNTNLPYPIARTNICVWETYPARQCTSASPSSPWHRPRSTIPMYLPHLVLRYLPLRPASRCAVLSVDGWEPSPVRPRVSVCLPCLVPSPNGLSLCPAQLNVLACMHKLLAAPFSPADRCSRQQRSAVDPSAAFRFFCSATPCPRRRAARPAPFRQPCLGSGFCKGREGLVAGSICRPMYALA